MFKTVASRGFSICFFIYCAMLRRARYCYGKSSVCPSVRNVESLRYYDLVGWNSSKIISWLISLWCSRSKDPNGPDITDLLQREHPKFWPEWGWCMEKNFRRTKALISPKRGNIAP